MNQIDKEAQRNYIIGCNRIIEEFEKWFDIDDKDDNDYFECGVNEIREFIKKLKDKTQ